MSKIRIYGDSAPLHIEIIPTHQGIDITTPGHVLDAFWGDPMIANLKKIIDSLDNDVSFHVGKHGTYPDVEGASGWVSLIDVLDDLTEALNENRG